MKKLQLSLFAASLAFAMNSSGALLVDRGLPTDNLNNAAGADRSNVDWGSESGVSLVGDTFKNTSTETWSINSIRLWTDGILATPPSAILWGGVDAGTLSVVSTSGALTPIAYANSQGYQSTSGSFYQLFQIDFAVNIVLAPGQTYSFFLDGTDPSYPPYIFAEASNRLLSGAPQDGADDFLLTVDILNGIASTPTSWTSLGNGWDKASDINIQVFGAAVPEPSTYLAGALLLLPFGASTLRVLRKQRTA